jgi:hypothetical protein
MKSWQKYGLPSIFMRRCVVSIGRLRTLRFINCKRHQCEVRYTCVCLTICVLVVGGRKRVSSMARRRERLQWLYGAIGMRSIQENATVCIEDSRLLY